MKNALHTSSVSFALVAATVLFSLPAQAQVEQLTLNGSVKQYLMNPHGDVDGILLDDGTQVDFPPHMANELVAAVEPGDAVNILGDRRESSTAIKADAITNRRTRRPGVQHAPSASEHLMPPHMKRLSMKEMTAAGTIHTLLYTPRGDVRGMVLTVWRSA
ncbi:MAG TPA: hypothetical protein VJ692_05310 [Nitrospiraceae bacterium]|nr:hypothetical protein [Nitrospiraceae bacterium]